MKKDNTFLKTRNYRRIPQNQAIRKKISKKSTPAWERYKIVSSLKNFTGERIKNVKKVKKFPNSKLLIRKCLKSLTDYVITLSR
jgi:hypothetical protein